MKYAAKMQQKDFPEWFHNVDRFWETWGKPEIDEAVRLPFDNAKRCVRTIRKAYEKERQSWNTRRRFRDNGRSGFIAWEFAAPTRRLIDEFRQNRSPVDRDIQYRHNRRHTTQVTISASEVPYENGCVEEPGSIRRREIEDASLPVE